MNLPPPAASLQPNKEIADYRDRIARLTLLLAALALKPSILFGSPELGVSISVGAGLGLASFLLLARQVKHLAVRRHPRGFVGATLVRFFVLGLSLLLLRALGGSIPIACLGLLLPQGAILCDVFLLRGPAGSIKRELP